MTPLPHATSCMIPVTRHGPASEGSPEICLLNDMDAGQVIEAGSVVGLAEPVQVLDGCDAGGGFASWRRVTLDQIPAHLTDLFNRSEGKSNT